MKRRRFVTGALAVGVVGAAAGTAGLGLRLHSAPRRRPFLTDAHLAAAAALVPRAPRVLFVGNSFTVQHDIPGQVAQAAEVDGVTLQVATAAANGARLIETWRLDAFRKALGTGWDVLVLQDFSATVLRAPDRWASAHAMRRMAQLAGARHVLLFPTWAFPQTHRVYRDGGGWMAAIPQDRQDFARRITDFHAGLAAAKGWTRAPVTEALHDNISLYTSEDGHHLNPEGGRVVSAVLWQSLRTLLPDQSSRA